MAVPAGYEIIPAVRGKMSLQKMLTPFHELISQLILSRRICLKRQIPLEKLDMITGGRNSGRSPSKHCSGENLILEGSDNIPENMEPYTPECTVDSLPDGLTIIRNGNTYDISARKILYSEASYYKPTARQGSCCSASG